MNKIRCYLDTNIFLDYIRKRAEDSIYLIDHAGSLNITLLTSYFTYLEMFDNEAEDYFTHRELMNKRSFDEIRKTIYDRNLKKNELKVVLETTTEKTASSGGPSKNIEFDLYYLDDEGWNYAMELMSEINIHSTDAIHLATAIKSGCDLLLTKDSHFTNNAKEKIRCLTPKQLMRELSSGK